MSKNNYCCVLTWFCLFFISLTSVGITLSCIPIKISFPVYQTWNGELSHYYDNQYIYKNLALGVIVSVVGFFGFIITVCFACVLKKKSVPNNFDFVEPVQREYIQIPPQINYQQPMQFPVHFVKTM
ncbi:Hypothetical_protein [Hexamita inflata]|uniref:Hypothetical_protein n=1 Tax=Hexamita inflata TaxID=28002 RepID=A0AA86UVT8_9EUKA|nr:Hypothetical protein HINF_LOCUS57569 [Hexamita inflata]